MCRIGVVETARAVSLAAGEPVAAGFRRQRPAFGVVELDQELAEHAAGLETVLCHTRAMATDELIAVTGATGGIGGRVAARLADRGVEQRLVVRDASRAPELDRAGVAQATYGDGEAMRTALAAVGTLFLVSGSEARDRVRDHVSAVDAAVAAGVTRIVYLSFMGAAPDATFTFVRDHYATEQHIHAGGLAHTFLRSCMYADYVPVFTGADGVIRGPAGRGRVAWVARDDIADVVAATLFAGGGRDDGEALDMTGPEALTMAETAEVLAEIAGREVVYDEETLEQARESRRPSGAPDWEIEGW